MASQFDAVARISVDLKGFRQAANQVTRSGGDMERVFKNLHGVLNKTEVVEKKVAAGISRTMGLYSRTASAAKNYATAVQALAKNEVNAEKGAKLMSQAFHQLHSSMSSIKGLSEKEAARLSRTLSLYERQVNVIKQLAQAQQAMAAVTQGAQRLEQAATKERTRAAEAARKLEQAEKRIAIARQTSATAAQNAAAAELRAKSQLIAMQQRLTEARNREAAAAQRSAQANRQAATSMQGAQTATFGLRSALSDLEGVYRQTIQAIVAVGQAAVSTAISHEAAFAQVARVTELTGSSLESLRKEAAALTAQLPVGFEELAKAMQLASQTGIANDQLIEFTRTVVNFSVTTGIATEQVTLLFGRIQTMRNIPISQMDNFASAVLALGVSSAATENEILKITESIATVTDLFGLSTPATLGLSSALATLRVRPELSRGALTRIFREMSNAVGEGGERLRVMSQIMGRTELDVKSLLETNPDQFFLDFIKGLGGTTTEAGALQRVLRLLNINAVRDIDTISRLANNYDTLESHVGKAYEEFELGNKLQEQAQVILATTRQEIDNLIDAFQTFMATGGEPFAHVIGSVASSLKTLVELASAAPGPIKAMGIGLGILLSLIAAFAAYRLAVTTAMRITLAFNEAQARGGVGTAGPITAYRGLRDVLNTYIASAVGATRATTQLTTAQGAAAGSATAMRSAQALAATSMTGVVAGQTAAAGATNRLATAQSAAAANSQRMLGAMTSASAITGALVASQREAASTAQRLGTAQSAVMTSTAGQAAAARNSAANIRNLGISTAALSQVTATYGSALVGAYKSQQLMASTATTSAAAQTVNTAALTASTGAATAFGAAGAFVMRNWLPIALIGLTVVPVLMSLGVGLSKAKTEAEEAGDKAFEAAGGFSELSRAIQQDAQQGAAAGPVFQTLSASMDDLSASQREKAEADRDGAAKLKTYGDILGTVSTSTSAAEVAARRHNDSVGQSTVALDSAGKKIQSFNEALKDNTFELRDNARAFIENTLRSAIMGTELASTQGEIKALKVEGELLQKVMKTVFAAPVDGKTGMTQATGLLKNRIDDLTKSIDLNKAELLGLQAARQEGAVGLAGDEQAIRKETDALENQRKVLSNTQEALKKISGEMDRAAIASVLFGDSTKTGAQKAKGTFDEAGNAADELGDAMQELSVSAQGLAEAYTGLIDPTEAWKGANEEAEQSIASFTKRLQEQVVAAQNFAQNLAILSSRGYTALVEQLRAMGPEGAAAAAKLVDGTKGELDKLEGVATQAGEAYKNALSTTLDVVGNMEGLGVKNAQALTGAIVRELNATAASGGDLQMSRDKILAALQLISKEKIAPQIVIDILKAQGDVTKIQAIIATASANGSLDAKGKATLNQLLYMQALTDLQAGVREIEIQGSLDPKAKGKLTTEEFNAKLAELQGSVAAKTLAGVLDPKGRAGLDEKQFRQAVDALSVLVLSSEEQGKFNPDGSANLNSKKFNELLEQLRGRIKAMENGGSFDPDGSADVDLSRFNQKLRQMESASYSTGNTIQNNLSRNATVNIGYNYYQKNQPPTVRAAAGGWINGPGGPTDDKIPAMLSNGEFVVRAAQARRYGRLLEAINTGRLSSGVTARLTSSMASEAMKPMQLVSADLNKAMTQTLIQRLPSKSSMQTQYVGPQNAGPSIYITNQYPQAEPTSVTINRSLAYAASLSGV